MKILIAGASGLIGDELIESIFMNTDYEVNLLTRNPANYKESDKFPVNVYYWDPQANKIDLSALENVDIVINLAGANISESRWSSSRKEIILQSRILSTKLLLESLNKSNSRPKKFIQASAIGIYKDNKTICDESSPDGDDFLAEVCKKWEQEFSKYTVNGMKKHILRIGPVLSSKGGMLKKLLPVFEKGYGSVLGTGEQYISWIHIDDVIGAIFHLIENDNKELVFNATAPSPVTNKVFTNYLAKGLNKNTFISPPNFVLKILLGEMSEMILNGQNVVPRNLINSGYKFKFNYLAEALTNLLEYKSNKESVFVRYQWVKKPVEEVFEFFSSEKNLEIITPDSLSFKVLDKSSKEIEKDTIINYRLKLYQLPLKWTTLISSFEKNRYFIDKQISGPYKKWVHLHEFKEMRGGTLIKDTVVYKVPLGRIGKLFAGNFIRKDITKIFNYRNKTIHKILSEPLT